MRTNHFLKRNQQTYFPKNILIIDTEANIKKINEVTEEQTFRLGSAYPLLYENHWLDSEPIPLHSIEQAWDLLDRYSQRAKRKNTHLLVVAHNMAYDYAILKLNSYISSRNLEITTFVISPPFIVKAGNITFLSSTNFFHDSLENLGKAFGIQKLKCDFKTVDDSELLEYCIQDTNVLRYVMRYYIDFARENNLGCFKMTLPSQAFTAFRHRFMKTNLLIHTYPEILEMEQKSYRGGRNETFCFEKLENIYELDVNSMYPYVMSAHAYPTMPVHTEPVRDCSVSKLKKMLDSGLFILADCNIDLNQPLIAVKREKLLFPIGHVNQIILSPEIEYLLEHPEVGEIKKINRLVGYKQSKIFAEYVDWFYKIRCQTENESIRYMCKLFLNSLYGKFGQRQPAELKLVDDINTKKLVFKMMDDSETNQIDNLVRIGNDLYSTEENPQAYADNSIPIIASAVTAYARIYLFDLFRIAGFENIFYCDTDSIFTNKTGYENLVSNGMVDANQLGKLKLKRIGTFHAYGNKDYRFGDDIKLKGIKKNATKISDTQYIQPQFLLKKSRIRNGIPDGKVVIRYVSKTLKREYDKATVLLGHAMPFSFSDW